MMRFGRQFATTTNRSLNILFFGNDDFALAHLLMLNQYKKMEDSVLNRVDVVFSSKKCDVAKYVAAKNLKFFKWSPVSSFHNQYDVAIVVSFGHLIPEEIINQFSKGMINVHPSLLPEWRGAAPIEHAILSGQQKSGISVVKIEPHKFDTGRLLLQKPFEIRQNSDNASLRSEMASVGSEMLIAVLKDLDWHIENSQKQDHKKVTQAPKLTADDAKVDWRYTVEQLDRQYRALGSTFYLRSLYKDLPIKLLDMVPVAEMKDLTNNCDFPGEKINEGYPHYLKEKELLCVKCQDGWVGFKNIIIKKTMSAKAFYNGYLSKDENKNVIFETLNCGLIRFPYWKQEIKNT